MMIPNQNAHAMTTPTYAEAIVAVGRMLKPKAGEPRVHQLVASRGDHSIYRTRLLEPGTGRFAESRVWGGSWINLADGKHEAA